MTTRRFDGDGSAALTGFRLRRLISFLRRYRLYATAHALERETGVYFDAAHFRRMLVKERCRYASSYAHRFVTPGDSNVEGVMLLSRILILRVVAEIATGRTRLGDGPFYRLYNSLDAYPNSDALRTLLISMHSDRAKASRLHQRFKPNAVEVVMDWVAKCPELKDRTQLPRCTFDPAHILSLGPRLWGCTMHRKNKSRYIPAHVLARSFVQKRAPSTGHKMNHSGESAADEHA